MVGLDMQLLLEVHEVYIDLVLVRERAGHALPLHAPLPPLHQLPALLHHAHVAARLQRVEPAVEGYKCHINQPEPLPPEEGLVAQLLLQHLKTPYQLLLRRLLHFSARTPHQSPSAIYLHANIQKKSYVS